MRVTGSGGCRTVSGERIGGFSASLEEWDCRWTWKVFVGTSGLAPAFKRVRAAFLSHGRSDWYGGLVALMAMSRRKIILQRIHVRWHLYDLAKYYCKPQWESKGYEMEATTYHRAKKWVPSKFWYKYLTGGQQCIPFSCQVSALNSQLILCCCSETSIGIERDEAQIETCWEKVVRSWRARCSPRCFSSKMINTINCMENRDARLYYNVNLHDHPHGISWCWGSTHCYS
jgi:hypothetical protein